MADTPVRRGQYLTEGLGHCGSCHTPRTWLNGPNHRATLAGGAVAGQAWYAPSIRGTWSAQETAAYLKNGLNNDHSAAGPMADVVYNSLQYFTQADSEAIGQYLYSLPAVAAKPVADMTPRTDPAVVAILRAGESVYKKNCSACHGEQGEGQSLKYPRLSNSPTLNETSGVNTIQLVLHGGFAPGTDGNPKPYGMPPFRILLNDNEVADVVSYIRNSWGNQGRIVSSFEVERLRTPPQIR